MLKGEIVFYFHALFFFFGMFGCFLPKKYLIYHLATFPLSEFVFRIDHGRCFLHDWEWKLGTADIDPSSSDPFFKKIAKRFFGITDISDETLSKTIYFGFMVSVMISFYRLAS